MASIKDLKRMCKSHKGCYNCPLGQLFNDETVPCIPLKFPDNAEEVIDKWVQEHPIKTYATDFFQ